jgi:MFS family permease
VRRLAETIGRRDTVMVAHNLFVILAGCVLYTAVQTRLFELFILGRLLTGISRQFALFMPIFLAEVAPSEHRGFVGTVCGVSKR